jgi:hypothetical protein
MALTVIKRLGLRFIRGVHLVAVFGILSCGPEEQLPKEWQFSEVIALDSINPIGIALQGENLWLSDGDHNRVARLDVEFRPVEIIDSLDRPMHIDAMEGILFVPQYGNDEVLALAEGSRERIVDPDSLDAPAGISVDGNQRAIADFYNNRILFNNGSEWVSIGKEGKGEGEFYYPTDVQLSDGKIWVADAYNHRVQVFDASGNFLSMFGQDQKMNASTGLFVTSDMVVVTDFENHRVLVFELDGTLKQILTEGIHKPTDVLVVGDTLYICNYQQAELVLYQLKAAATSDS